VRTGGYAKRTQSSPPRSKRRFVDDLSWRPEAAGVEFIDENGGGTGRSPSEAAKAEAVRTGDVFAKRNQSFELFRLQQSESEETCR
jgi:hypothetical protein